MLPMSKRKYRTSTDDASRPLLRRHAQAADIEGAARTEGENVTRLIDLTGQTFGRLTVLKKASSGRRTYWLCHCSCGRETTVMRDNLIKKTSATVSCGCRRAEALKRTATKHGLSKRPEFKVWIGLIDRCSNKNYYSYDRYGERGISVCKRWQKFENFYDDMGSRPSPKHQIDRIDNDGNYEPRNCRWATHDEQMGNRSTSIVLDAFGRRQCIGQWERETGIDRRTLHRRMKKLGMTLEAAISARDGRYR